MPAPAASPQQTQSTALHAVPDSLLEMPELLELRRNDGSRFSHRGSDLLHTRVRSRSLSPTRRSPPMRHVFGRLIASSEMSQPSCCFCACCHSTHHLCGSCGCPCELGVEACSANDSPDVVCRFLPYRPALGRNGVDCGDIDIHDLSRNGDDDSSVVDVLVLEDPYTATAVPVTLCDSVDRASSVLRTVSLPTSTSTTAQQAPATASPVTTAAAAVVTHSRPAEPQRRVRLTYRDEAVRARFCNNAQRLIASAQSDPNSTTSSAHLARKALRYRHVSLERVGQADTLDPTFDVSAFFGVEWCKS